MGAPVGRLDLVADQRVDARRVGGAQQRLGEAHQTDALRRGQPVLAEKRLHQRRRRLLADPGDEARGVGGDGGAGRRVETSLRDGVAERLRLGDPVAGADRGAAVRRVDLWARGGVAVRSGLGAGHGGASGFGPPLCPARARISTVAQARALTRPVDAAG